MAVAIPLGLTIGTSRCWEDALFPALEVFRPVPPVAWVPIALLLLPTFRSGVIFVVFLGAFFPILVNTIQGVKTVEIEVWERDNRTVLFITHDVEEAILLADRVVVMTARPGRVKDVIDVDLDRPRDPEVVTTERFTELRERALSVIREEAERA